MGHESTVSGKTIHTTLADVTRSAPANVALLGPGTIPANYQDLLQHVWKVAGSFANYGVASGDKVATVVSDSPEMATLFLGCASVATCAPLNPRYRSSDFELYLADLKPKLVVVDSDLDSPVREVAKSLAIPVVELRRISGAKAGHFELESASSTTQIAQAEANDIALVLHTSGTTSRPKMVPISHANLIASVGNIARSLALSPADRCLNIMPLFHVHGLIGALLSSLYAGASVVCTPGFQAPLFRQWLDEFHPTWYSGVPTMHRAILEQAKKNPAEVSRNSLRFIRSCSAALPPETMKEIEAAIGVPVIEAYGMTEASHQMASNPLPPSVRKPGSVGISTGVQIAIMNERGEFLPAGMEGEIVIQGPNVISGYEHNPEANKKSFTNGWFRTGDQGRLDNDGYLFITGRIKELIVRGGEKISPREIDELLLTHPAVAQALAFAIPDEKLGEEVGAAIVLKAGQSVRELELCEHVARRTADFKVPRKIVFMDKLPTGPTGKLQRIGLAAVLGLDKSSLMPQTSPEFVAPRNVIEQSLAGIWTGVLHRTNPSVTEDFFAVGGDSILAAQLVGRIRKQLGFEVSIPRLFASPSIAGLAEWLHNQPSGANRISTTIVKADRSQGIPLSFPQRRMWFAAEFAGKSPVYNRGFALRLRGPLDLFRIQQSLTEVVEHHAILRTNYSVHDGMPVQKVGPVRPVAVSLVDLSRGESEKRMEAAAEWVRDEFRKPFNLSSDLMLRAGIAKIDQNDHVLLFISHHIAFDATSQPPFLRDLGAAYRGSLKALEANSLDYPDFAAWQAGQDSEALDLALQWWKRELASLADLHTFPGDFARPLQQSYRGGTVTLSISEELKDKVSALARELEATPFMVLLAAFHALAARYSGLDDSVVGTPIAGRTAAETEDMVGLFVNLLVLRTKVPLDRTFRDLVQSVRTATLDALDHQDLPFEKLVEGLSPERSLSRSPLFQVMFEYRNHAVGQLEIEGISAEPFEFETGTSQYDLHLDLSPRESDIHCALRYSADLFKHESAGRILEDYVILLASALEKPERLVAELPCSVTPGKAPADAAVATAYEQIQSGIPRSRRSPDEPCPVSFAQERLWFLHQLEPDNSTYNIPVLLNMKGKLDREALRHAFEVVLQRHESLRTVFHSKDGAPVQIVQPVRDFPLPLIDVANLSDAELDDLARKEILRPFDLTKDAMVRAMLYSREPENHNLLIVVHHIAADGWSMPILHQELGAAYSALVRGRTPQLQPLPIQYADFANWQRGFLSGKLLQDQLDFWTRQLKDAPSHPLLLTDRPRGARQTYAGKRRIVPMSPEFESELNEFNRKERVTLFMTLLAALQSLLHRMTGETDIVIGAPIANRTRMELEPLIGFFVNTLAFRSDFSANLTFRDVLNRVRETTIQAYQNQDLPFEKLVQALQPERSLSHTPIFQVIFALQNTPDENADFGGLMVSPRDIDERIAKFDLSIFVEFKPHPRIVYNPNTDLFEHDTVLRFARRFENLVRSAMKSPDTLVSELDWMGADERAELMAWTRTAAPYPQKAVHEIFEEVVAKSPEATAIVAGSKEYSYRELNDRANQIAETLRHLSVVQGMRVGLLMRRSFDAIASMLATLKVGAAYVPLDKDHPSQGIEFICKDCGTAAILTSPDLVTHAPERQTVIALDEVNGNRAYVAGSAVTPDQEAYVMYTSGSTGQPKGVAIPHRGIVRLVFSQEYAAFGPSETTLQLAPLSFDASTLEIWAALLHGGKCVLYSGSRIDAEQVGNAIRTHGVSTLWLTASLFNSIIDESPEALSPVRQLLAGGEALSVPHVRRAFQLLKKTQLINGYGPTENTTFSCCHRITGETLATRSTIPIGKPIANTEAYILDSRLQLVPIGVPGELCLGGDGLAIGYVNRPDLNAEKFVSVNLPNGSTSRLYRTGDICRWLNDGCIEFLGRKDEQVKIRGFRIELGEVETAIAGNPAVNSVAVVITGEGANKRLAAYVVTKPEHELAGPKLREYLRERLPEYMIPANYVFLPALPISTNGKVDKSALPDPGGAPARPVVAEPHDSIEAKLKSIWENVLGTAPIGIDQDFFELGGHSLLATKLLARVERTFAVKLPIAAIFQYSTITEFAPLVRNQLATAQQAPGARPPMIWVGGGTFLRAITKWLQPDRNVISISLEPDEWASIDPPYRLENIASTLATRILRDCPRGPYHLGGWCYEGILAYETAQQLRSRGANVGLLVLVDAATPLSRTQFSGVGEVIARIQREVFHLQRMARMKPSNWLLYLRERFDEFSQQLRRRKWQSSYGAGAQNQSAGDEESNRVLHLAMMEYVPKPYHGSVLFFQAAQRPMGKYWDLAWEWKALAGDQCVCREIQGDHVTLLKPPNIDILADDLKSALDASVARESLNRQTADVGRS